MISCCDILLLFITCISVILNIGEYNVKNTAKIIIPTINTVFIFFILIVFTFIFF